MNDNIFFAVGALCIFSMVFISWGLLWRWVVRLHSFARKNGLSIIGKHFFTGLSWGRQYTMTGKVNGREVRIVYPLVFLYGRTSFSVPFFKPMPKAHVQVYIDDKLVLDQGYWYMKVSLEKLQHIIEIAGDY